MNRESFLQDNTTGMLWCSDNAWRRNIHTNRNVKGCLKFWKKAGFAERFAEKIRLKHYTIIHVYEGDEVDSTGQVKRARHIRGFLSRSRKVNNITNNYYEN